MGRSTRRARFVLVLSALLAGALLPGPAGAAVAKDPAGADRVKVIVTLDAKPGRAADRAIEKHGGKVRARLALINGISAVLSRGEMKQLAREPGVRRVELDPTLTAIDPAVDAAAATPEYDNAWGVSRIGAAAVHAAGIRIDLCPGLQPRSRRRQQRHDDRGSAACLTSCPSLRAAPGAPPGR